MNQFSPSQKPASHQKSGNHKSDRDREWKSFLAELKARLRVSDIVGQYIPLKRQGREWKALSPFTSEKSPSFTVNDQKQFWHCFSSNKHGDVISFLTETQNLSFMEAVERCAKQAGLTMPRLKALDPKRQEHHKTSLSALLEASLWFHQQLDKKHGAVALDYLKHRHISAQICERFSIGFAPPKKGLLRSHLHQKGFADSHLIEAGLLVQTEPSSDHNQQSASGQRQIYDRFFNRIMFPISSRDGTIIGFGARALDPKAKAKYLNSPETIFFHKGSILYGLDKAAKPIFDNKRMIIVEGYMDVLALHQAGFDDAVASLGTALGEEQIKLAWTASDSPMICLDGDEAGRRAANLVIERVLPLLRDQKTLSFVHMPQGKDPDDVINEGGASAFAKCLADAKPLSQAFYLSGVADKDFETPESQAAMRKKFDRLISAIRDLDIQHYYRQIFRTRLDSFFYNLNRQRASSEPHHLSAPRLTPDGLINSERILLGILMKRADLLEKYQDDIANLYLSSKPHEHLRDQFLSLLEDYQGKINELAPEIFYERLPAEFHPLLDSVYGRDEQGTVDGHNFNRLTPFFTPNPFARAFNHQAPKVAQEAQEGAQEGDDLGELYLDFCRHQQYHQALERERSKAYQDYQQQENEDTRQRFIQLEELCSKDKEDLLNHANLLAQKSA